MSDPEVGGFVPRRYVVASYVAPGTLLEALRRLAPLRLGRLDTHSAYPLPGVDEVLGLRRARIPLLVLCGALLGAATGYGMIYYMNVVDWPINVGNRPPHSPPAFIPITFELAVLFGAGFAFFGLLILAGLPRPYHPVFQARTFAQASLDRFLLSLELPAGADLQAAVDRVQATSPERLETVEEWER